MAQKPDRKEPNVHSDEAPEVYNRLLERVYQSLENFEEKSWPYIKKKVEEAAEIELAAREMTREEMDLLQAYLQRDLKELGFVAHKTGESLGTWLNIDFNVLEQRMIDMLASVADKTRIEQVELQQRLDHGPEDLLAGEVAAAGTLVCLECEQRIDLSNTAIILPCPKCGGHYFHRVAPVTDSASQPGDS